MQNSTLKYSTAPYSTEQYSTVRYSTVQYSTAQCSTVQYSTVQHSTVQYSTVQYVYMLQAHGEKKAGTVFLPGSRPGSEVGRIESFHCSTIGKLAGEMVD